MRLAKVLLSLMEAVPLCHSGKRAFFKNLRQKYEKRVCDGS